MKIDKKSQQLLNKLRQACRDYNWEAVDTVGAELAKNVKDESIRNPIQFILQLSDAVDKYNKSKVAELVEAQIFLVKHQQDNLNDNQRIKILKILKAKRYFKLLAHLADAMIFSGCENITVKNLLSQALIEQGQFASAENNLDQIIKALPANTFEYQEACGLKGRLHKQHYINTADDNSNAKVNLVKSIDAYRRVYSKDKSAYWHGINLMGLIERAKRSHIKIPRPLNSQRIASQILKKIENDPCVPAWDKATAAEACLGLGKFDQALDWLVDYSQDKRADAFEIASTLRQLKEVWQLDPANPEHSKLLHVLNSALLMREGGQIDIPAHKDQGINPEELMTGNFEKILGKDGPKKFQWYLNGIKRAQSVGLIKDLNGQGTGTGFLMKASDLNAAWGNGLVMVTNEHVVSENPGSRRNPPLLPEQARIMFEILPNQNIEYQIKEILFSSHQDKLDVTIFKLDQSVSAKVDPYPVSKFLPVLNDNQRIYVIGHPLGGGLTLSIHDNLLLDHKDPKIHYRTPTEPGSSGSPVFNGSWELLAVHHAGGEDVQKLNGQGRYEANEGIWIQSILRMINH